MRLKYQPAGLIVPQLGQPEEQDWWLPQINLFWLGYSEQPEFYHHPQQAQILDFAAKTAGPHPGPRTYWEREKALHPKGPPSGSSGICVELDKTGTTTTTTTTTHLNPLSRGEFRS